MSHCRIPACLSAGQSSAASCFLSSSTCHPETGIFVFLPRSALYLLVYKCFRYFILCPPSVNSLKPRHISRYLYSGHILNV